MIFNFAGKIRRKINTRSVAQGMAMTLVLTLLTVTDTYAYDLDRMNTQLLNRELNGIQDTSDVAAWRQGRVPYNSAALKKNTAESTVYSGGCSYFAAAYMLVKMGQLDVVGGENPNTVISKMEEIDGWLDFGKMDYSRIKEAYPAVTCHAYKNAFENDEFDEQLDIIRSLIDQGYFVILCIDGPGSAGHYIFVDEVTDDGDMVIGDSAYEGTAWSDYFENAGFYLVDYSIFTCDGVVPSECPSIYDYNKEELSDEVTAPTNIDTSPHTGTNTNIQWLLNPDDSILEDRSLYAKSKYNYGVLNRYISLPSGKQLLLDPAEETTEDETEAGSVDENELASENETVDGNESESESETSA
jgi:hypothetical protein